MLRGDITKSVVVHRILIRNPIYIYIYIPFESNYLKMIVQNMKKMKRVVWLGVYSIWLQSHCLEDGKKKSKKKMRAEEVEG